MGVVWLICCAVAAYRLHGTGWFVPAIIVAVVNFWSFGVMSNYAGDDVTHRKYQSVVVTVHVLSTVAGLALCGLSLLS